jgi:GAF domain-containing protein
MQSEMRDAVAASPIVDEDRVAEACERARRLIDDDAPLHEVLTCLVAAAEAVSGPRAVASVLVLDKDGLLRNGASPNLPRDYLDAIDRLKPNASVGTCAAAAATGSVVVTPSFLADGKWAELRHLPLALGFTAAWSMPIKSSDGRVLGTFGTYFRDERQPTARELAAVRDLAEVAGSALERAGG